MKNQKKRTLSLRFFIKKATFSCLPLDMKEVCFTIICINIYKYKNIPAIDKPDFGFDISLYIEHYQKEIV